MNNLTKVPFHSNLILKNLEIFTDVKTSYTYLYLFSSFNPFNF